MDVPTQNVEKDLTAVLKERKFHCTPFTFCMDWPSMLSAAVKEAPPWISSFGLFLASAMMSSAVLKGESLFTTRTLPIDEHIGDGGK